MPAQAATDDETQPLRLGFVVSGLTWPSGLGDAANQQLWEVKSLKLETINLSIPDLAYHGRGNHLNSSRFLSIA